MLVMARRSDPALLNVGNMTLKLPASTSTTRFAVASKQRPQIAKLPTSNHGISKTRTKSSTLSATGTAYPCG